MAYYLEIAFVGILILVAVMLYITYLSIQHDAHSPAALQPDKKEDSLEE